MRAIRLMSILLLLQSRGRLTAEELAAHFEVSVRTIYRDIDQLSAAASVMATLLTEDIYADHPLTLKGKAVRLVIYGAYGTDAISLEDPDPLQQNPTEGDWTLFVPCPDEDLDWTRETLAKRAPRIRVHAVDETPAEIAEEKAEATHAFAIDWEAIS